MFTLSFGTLNIPPELAQAPLLGYPFGQALTNLDPSPLYDLFVLLVHPAQSTKELLEGQGLYSATANLVFRQIQLALFAGEHDLSIWNVPVHILTSTSTSLVCTFSASCWRPPPSYRRNMAITMHHTLHTINIIFAYHPGEHRAREYMSPPPPPPLS